MKKISALPYMATFCATFPWTAAFFCVENRTLCVKKTILTAAGVSSAILWLRQRASLLPVSHEYPPESFLSEHSADIEKISGLLLRFVPGAACLETACAAKIWLSCCGISSRIVVGHAENTFPLHAWLEWTEGTLFRSDDAMTPVFDEEHCR